MSKGLKTVLIIFGIMVLIGLSIFALCTFGVIKGGGLLIDEYNKFQDEFLTEACKELEGADYTESEYEELFSKEFKSEYTYVESKGVVQKFFKQNSCADFKVDTVWDMVSKGMSVNYNSDVFGETTLTISYQQNQKEVTLYMVKEGDDWKIQSMKSY